MNNFVRFFALFVAIAGLACATLAPANPRIRTSHNSAAVTEPGLMITLPGPVICQETNTCFAPKASTR
jgi:hypothetical protein